MKCDSRGNNCGPQQLCRKCSANFSTKALICLNPTLDSAQVGLSRFLKHNLVCMPVRCGRVQLRADGPNARERASRRGPTQITATIAPGNAHQLDLDLQGSAQPPRHSA